MRYLPVVPMCRSRPVLIAPPNQQQHPARPASIRGALRGRHERWVRDAMDAAAAQDERRYCGLEKSCGPDAPTLASSLRKHFRRRRWQKSPVTGESTKETVKTIAQGMPVDGVVPVVTNSSCFLTFAREAMGAARTRHSLRPLLSRVMLGKARADHAAGMRSCVFSLAPHLRGEGWGEGLAPQTPSAR
jgi:hypothetical protein